MSLYKWASLAVLLLTLFGCRTQPAADLTGSWDLDMAFPDKGITSMQGDMGGLQQTGTAITGTALGGDLKGTINGSRVTLTVYFKAYSGETVPVVFKGKVVDANTLKGTVNFLSRGSGTWTAKRKAEKIHN